MRQPPTSQTPLGTSLPGAGAQPAPQRPSLSHGAGGQGVWVMVKLNIWFSRGFEGLLPSIS